jgi:hypothetical protein
MAKKTSRRRKSTTARKTTRCLKKPSFRKERDQYGRRVALLSYSGGGVLALFVVLGGAWLFLKLLLCWGGAGSVFCDRLYLGPLITGVTLFGIFVWILIYLHNLGRRFDRQRRRKLTLLQQVQQPVGRARLGYENLQQPRRKHVYLPSLYVLAMLGSFAGFLIFYLDFPALASILFGMVFPLSLLLYSVYTIARRRFARR